MKKAAVVIPVYKNSPKKAELLALSQCKNILKNYDIFFVTHKGLDLSAYDKKNCAVEYFDEKNFKSVKAYSKFCLDENFYKRFKDYEYMFLFQLDGWIFKDELEYWCNKGFDYIGAPWFEGYDKASEKSPFIVPSGNGGVSLRKIEKFINILENHNAKILNYKNCLLKYGFLAPFKYFSRKNDFKYVMARYNEDFVIAKYFTLLDETFKVAPPETSMYFSFEVLPQKLYRLTNGKLPFACHAFERYDKEFWSKFINLEDTQT